MRRGAQVEQRGELIRLGDVELVCQCGRSAAYAWPGRITADTTPTRWPSALAMPRQDDLEKLTELQEVHAATRLKVDELANRVAQLRQMTCKADTIKVETVELDRATALDYEERRALWSQALSFLSDFSEQLYKSRSREHDRYAALKEPSAAGNTISPRRRQTRGRPGRGSLPVHTRSGRYTLNYMVQCSTVRLDASFGALSDATRRGVLEQLGRADSSITELAETFHMTLTGMKKHVVVLEQAGLVATEKVGRVRTCRLGPRRLAEETAWIEAYRQLWVSRFDALDEIIEELKQKEKVDGRQGSE